jgi:hypothetical protein
VFYFAWHIIVASELKFKNSIQMKKHATLIIAAAATAMFSSCSTTMYVSNAVNVPLLKEKGEVKINVDQNDLQMSVAVGENLGVMVNGFYKSHTADNNYSHKGQLAEVGVGYFRPLGHENVIFETYGGIGVGTLSKRENFRAPDNSAYTASFSAQGTKLFLQPSIGYASRYFDVAFTPRFSFVKYTRFNSEYYTDLQLAEDYLDNDRIKDGMFAFAEPAITLRGGYKFIKLQLQYGLTMNMGTKDIRHDNSFSSIGLVLDLAKWYNAE